MSAVDFNPSMIDLERRTGVKNEDIDNFVNKATLLEEAIRGLRDGTVDPMSIRIPGIDCDSEEEKAVKQAEKAAQAEKRRQASLALEQQRKAEERELWWSGAELQVTRVEANDVDDDKAIDSEAAEKQARMNRYLADYSRWDQWVPADPASVLEMEEETKKKESVANAEFEKNNADFCSEFLSDVEKRNKAVAKKRDSADALRLRGNAAYKRREYKRALDTYAEALRALPYATKTLLNVAQCMVKLGEMEDALEYLARVLYLDERNSKAWNRKAFVLKELHRLEEAHTCSQRAVDIDPSNADISALHVDIESSIRSEREERDFAALCCEEKDKVCAAVKAFMMSTETSASLSDPTVARAVSECTLLARENAHCQVHMRAGGAIARIAELLRASPHSSSVTPLLSLLAAAIENQKVSILRVLESEILAEVAQLACLTQAPDLLCAYLEVLTSACSESSLAKPRELALSNAGLVKNVARVMADAVEKKQSAHITQMLSFLKLLVFSAEAKTIMDSIGDILMPLGLVLTETSGADENTSTAIEVLVGCSQLKQLRELFFSTKIKPQTSLLNALCVSVNLANENASNAVGVLINLCIDTNEQARLDIVKSGCLSPILTALKQVASGSIVEFCSLRLRCFNLLSRLSIVSETQAKLYQPDGYRSLCRGIKVCGCSAEAWRKEYGEYFVKVLACLVDPSDSCKAIAKEEGLVKALLSLFPTPRCELGEVTPSSVTLMPKIAVAPMIVGNAARCLMPFADDFELFEDQSSLGVEKLICSMASCTDIRVRRNIAILLAKGCKINGIRDKVEKFRGIQMMIELQNLL